MYPTAKQDLERFLRHLRTNKRSAGYIDSVKNYGTHLAEFTGKPFLENTREDYERWAEELSRHGTGRHGLSSSTMFSTWTRTKVLLRWLNGGEAPKAIRGLKFGKSGISRVGTDDELLTDGDIKKIGKLLAQPWRTVFLILANTGARPTEILRLNVGDVVGPKTAGGRIFYDIHIKQTKTDRPRTSILYDRGAIASLEEWAAQAGSPKSGPLFPGRTHNYRIYDSYGTALLRAGVSEAVGKNVYPYLTRHSYISKLKRAGVEDSAIMREVGLTKVQSLENYSHLSNDQHRDGLLSKIEDTGEAATAIDIDALVEARVREEQAQLEERFKRLEFLLEQSQSSPAAKELLRREKKGEKTGVLVEDEEVME